MEVNLEGPDLPSALLHRDELAARLAGKRLAVFLDFDGTLTPVVDEPDMVRLSDSMRGIVRTLAERCPVTGVNEGGYGGQSTHGCALYRLVQLRAYTH